MMSPVLFFPQSCGSRIKPIMIKSGGGGTDSKAGSTDDFNPDPDRQMMYAQRATSGSPPPPESEEGDCSFGIWERKAKGNN